ncbi:type IX secretion system membrane protein PorP/SprF [Paraflavitalea soli]|uniref:Type IX secretion system membrane protein PorP/SprF n=1 Tax=Paraflavitalea soli TaxID=2315862 RepID=A0A3B7MWB7_9BACT|nr:type IX secretion system membrane protein PorP/SprF [Paraflavitalea soli]AXY75965.1 type IX secretion system membrane protein PorP/SprF [Paraflavitalea soli]
MRIFIIVLLITSANCLQAQTRPQQSLYMVNYTFLNPAAFGLEGYGQVQSGIRQQWAGIDGAPVTTWISGTLPVRNRNQPSWEAYDVENNEILFAGHGLGFNMFQDKIGPYSTINLNLGYAYHLPLSSSLALSMGVSGGMQQVRYDVSKSIYPDQPYDPAATGQAAILKKYSPDLNAGLLLRNRKFFLGASLIQILPSRFVDVIHSQSKYKPQLLTAGGYCFDLDEEGMALWLSGIVKSDFANPLRYDVSAKLRYRTICWMGLSYRMEDAIGGSLGLNITPAILVGYNYDWSINKLRSSYSKASHELMVGYRFLREGQSNMSRVRW